MNVNSNLFSVENLFENKLVLSLKLESDGKEAKLPSGNIERLFLNLHSYGHKCRLQFSTFDNDEIDQMFTGPKIMKASIAFKPVDPTKGTDPFFEIKGIVIKKSFQRIPSNAKNEKQAHRLYDISFMDNARATWEQHYPTNIYVDESMKDIIEKHINSEITMKYEWDPLEVKHPITAFSLEHKYWLPIQEQTNFYAFLVGYLHQENGILQYNYKEHSYKITGKKEKASGDPLIVYETQVTPPHCFFPLPLRYNTRVIKHTSDTIESEDKENPDSFKLVRRESIDPTNYRVYPEQANQKIQSVLTSDKNEIEVQFTTFSSDLQIDKLTPGSFLSFKGDLEGNWTRDANFKDKKFRIRDLYFEARKLSLTEDVLKNVQIFEIGAKAKLELEEETYVAWPHFVPPSYPFYIQGKVFSDVGDKEQSTYKILEKEEAPQGQYEVLIPLVGEDKKVVAPFEPAYSGQYYYPLCKDARVMLAMYFRTAKIERPIDWDPLARMPVGIQGNQNVLASNGKDKYTIIRHEFVDGKDSVLTIIQSSSETQTQTIQIKEKDILINVTEKDKKVLFMQLNHESGITLSLEDKDAGMNQQIVFDGKSMTHTCKGSDGTSIIEQKPDSISIDCKEFTIKSDKITFDASDCILQKGANKVDVETKVFNAAASSVKLG